MKGNFLLLLCFPFFCISQNVKGIVTSKTDYTPIENTTVFLRQNGTETRTNAKGEFSLKLPSGFRENDSIEFSHIGFTTAAFHFDELKKLNFTVSLSESIENLSGLTIVANQKLKLKPKLDFSKLTSIKYPLSSFGSLLTDDKIYIIGGDASFDSDAFNKIKYKKPDFTLKDYMDELRSQNTLQLYKDKLFVYDIKTDSWNDSELKFKKRAYHSLNYYNNTIYVIGGKRSSVNGKFEYLEDQIEVFDIANQTITIDKTNPHQAANSASFTYKDNIIIMGGSVKMNAENKKKEFTNKVHLYNITSGFWYELTNMPIAKEATGILVADKIYLIGGNNGKPISKIETYDLNTEKWTTEGELFNGLEKPAITNHENLLYFFEDRKMYIYDIKSKVLKEYIVELGLKASALYYDHNKLYILGGLIENEYSKVPSANVYSISIEEFETTQPNRIKIL